MCKHDWVVPHESPTREEKEQAVKYWRKAAAHERFRIEHGLCYGDTSTAKLNAALYDRTADEIEAEIREEEEKKKE